MSKIIYPILFSALMLTTQIAQAVFWEEETNQTPAPVTTSTVEVTPIATTSGKIATARLDTAVKKAPAAPPKPMVLPHDPSVSLRAPANNPTIDKNLRVSLQSNYMKEADRWYTNGANVNTTDAQGRGLLYLATTRRHQAGIEFLLLRKADVNQANQDGTTPLQAAVQSGQARVVQMLLERGAEVKPMPNGGTMIHYAMTKGFSQIAMSLIEKGVDVNKTYGQQKTLLHIAASRGMVGPALALIGRGANVNAQNSEDATPLHEAAARGQTRVVSLLLDRKASVKAETKRRWSPLHHAARFGHPDVVSILLSKGASPNDRNSEGKTPLALAQHLHHQNVVDILASRTRGGFSGNVSSNSSAPRTRSGWFW